MPEIKAKVRKETEHKADLLAEVKRLLDENGIKAKIEVSETHAMACPGCIACTCMIWI